jgi:hypothetical protein
MQVVSRGPFPLRSFLRGYDRVCQSRCGRPDNPADLEQVGRELREGRTLEARDLERIFDPEKTHFGFFWKVPGGAARLPKDILLAEDPRPEWRKGVTGRLFRALGNIDTTSVVLQCVHPLKFGVYSPPVLSFFQLQPAEPVDHYIAYCDELRAWGDRFGIKTGDSVSVRETDKALWVFYELAYGPARDQKLATSLRKQFESDEWIRERRATNFLHPFLKSYDALAQARLMSDIDPNLAGKIAGCEFERLINAALPSERFQEMNARIDRLAKQRGLSGSQKEDLRAVWRYRCDAVHGRCGLNERDVRFMADTIKTLLGQPVAP